MHRGKKYYTESHEWIEEDDKGHGIVGITLHAERQLGDIVFVELPHIGQRLHASQEAAVLESTKSAVDVYSPVSGEVLEINDKLKEMPELINQAPETEGWLFKIKLAHRDDLHKLLSQQDYEKLI